MLRKFALTLAAIGALSTSAAAEEQLIMITDDGFFPMKTYFDPGDTVRFINTTTSDREIHAKKALNRWTTGVLEPGEEYVLVVSTGMQLQFRENFSGSTVGDFSFDNAPLN